MQILNKDHWRDRYDTGISYGTRQSGLQAAVAEAVVLCTVRRPSVGSCETAKTGLSYPMRQLFAGDYEMIVF